MKEYLPTIFFFVACASCGRNNVSEQIAAINNSLASANTYLSGNSDRSYDALQDRLQEFWAPATKDTWTPVLLTMKTLTDGMIDHIDSLIQQVQAMDNPQFLTSKADDLYSRLQAYNQAMLQAPQPAIVVKHPNIQTGMKSQLEIVRKSIDTAGLADQLKHVTSRTALAMLNKVKADVLMTEYHLLSYCSTNIGYPRRPCDIVGAIAALNSNYVKAGRPMQAYAGAGSFSAASKPIVAIDGKQVAVQQDGVAVYTFKAAGKPGVHVLPVCIEYNKPDGSYAIVNSKLEYIIAQ